MTRDYLSTRIVLSRCCVLVDCSRGLCKDDKSLLAFLIKASVPWQLILTKTDILSIRDLARSIAIVEKDLASLVDVSGRRLWTRDESEGVALVLPVSSSSGAGVAALWRELLACADATSRTLEPLPPPSRGLSSSAGASAYNPLTAILTSSRESDSEIARDPRIREHIHADKLRLTTYRSTNQS